jgi:hypothetical protein
MSTGLLVGKASPGAVILRRSPVSRDETFQGLMQNSLIQGLGGYF